MKEAAHYLFNYLNGSKASDRVARLLRAGMWAVDVGERDGDALAAGDLVLIYLGAPLRHFVGHAELSSATHRWTPDEARRYPGDHSRGVLLARIHEWDPPVPMAAVLNQLGPTARSDFEAGVVRITAIEYQTALDVAGDAR